jgi:hypothetical protein
MGYESDRVAPEDDAGWAVLGRIPSALVENEIQFQDEERVFHGRGRLAVVRLLGCRVVVQFEKEASQTRAILRAARPDPSLRKKRLLRMTSKLHHYQGSVTLPFAGARLRRHRGLKRPR